MTALGELTVDALLEELAAPAPAAAGAAAAALTAAMAASLVAMVARGATGWEDGEAVAERATALRELLVELAERDARAVARILELARERATGDDLAGGLVEVSAPPVAIAEAAAGVAALGHAAAREGKPMMRADAVAAELLARAAARTAAGVAQTNLAQVDGGNAKRGALLERVATALAAAGE